MTQIVRTFIGLPLEADSRRESAGGPDETGRSLPVSPLHQLHKPLKQLSEFGAGIRTVRAANLHVTIQFLGDTPLSDIPEIASAMSEAVESVRCFDWRVVGTGVFPNRKRPMVVWVGVEPAQRFQELASCIQRAVKPLGYIPESRPYMPHLTLARLRHRCPPTLNVWLDENSETEFWSGRAGRVHLFRSTSGTGGVYYESLAVALLGDQ